MSGSRKEFDVKQILRIRWRWFGHPTSPPPHSQALGDFFSGRGTGCTADSPSVSGCASNNNASANISSSTCSSNNRKFLESASHASSLSASVSVCPRSFSQQDCRSPPALPWVPTSHPPEVQELTSEGGAPSQQKNSEGPEAEELGQEGHNVDSDTSSCRTSNSSLTLSSCNTMEPCGPEEVFQALSHAEHTFRRMESYLRHKQLCDVVLLAGERRIPAHRLVLSSVSDYFAAMFTSDVREAKQEEVKMEGVDPDALWALVQYAYTGRLELREDTIESLLSASCLLQLSAVVHACCGFLIKQLHPSNCLGIRSFGDAQGCLDLHRVAHNYTMEHFLEVIRNQEFLLLPPGEIQKLLSSDDMNVPDEETVLDALLGWVQHDSPARQQHLPPLLAHIRLPLLAPQFLADMESNLLLRESVECQRLVMEAMKYHLLPERRPQLQSPRTRPRKATVGALFAVGGMDATKGATSIEQYCLRRDSWKQVAVMSGRRLQFGVAVLEDRLYVVGGRDGLKTLNTVECYNPRSRSWSVMPSMSTHRHGLGVAVLEGPMYAVGGHDGWSYLSTVERWDPQARQWSFVASMATPRSTVGVAVLNGKLYAVGGRDGSSCLKSVECFDPHTNKWSACAQMAKRRGGVGVATWNGFLYAIGGHDAPASSLASRLSDCVERYDPKTDAWTAVAPMSISRDAVGVCLLGDRLYAVGGYDGQVYLNTVEAYDPQTNEWTQVAPLCLGRAGACVVAVKL
ncbi:kelch-like protein 5 isoform X1 [Conger conger]|uniref:kelch-like protein 5 isoform X1 n=2 Tax=Conger conger TaxID=82655 RepID=UPI002A5983E9|nr:kelch-like protein 5 isoform X1 [Conger conger]